MRDRFSRFDTRAVAGLLAYLLGLTLAPLVAVAQQEQATEITSSKWQTYRNERYAFDLSYPADSHVRTSRDHHFQYVRITNQQIGSDGSAGLLAGEYLIEVFIFDHRQGHKLSGPCRELVRNAHPVKAGKVNALRGQGDPADDAVGIPSALCLQGVKVDVLIKGIEEEQGGTRVSRILDSVRFGS
jgi:hypothetical protein